MIFVTFQICGEVGRRLLLQIIDFFVASPTKLNQIQSCFFETVFFICYPQYLDRGDHWVRNLLGHFALLTPLPASDPETRKSQARNTCRAGAGQQGHVTALPPSPPSWWSFPVPVGGNCGQLNLSVAIHGYLWQGQVWWAFERNRQISLVGLGGVEPGEQERTAQGLCRQFEWSDHQR